MTMRRRSVFAVATTVLWLGMTAVPSYAQDTESPSFAERIDVQLINVDVWVTDDDGRPATGLTAADFELIQDGRPVPITHFTEIRGGSEFRETSDSAPVADAAERIVDRDPTAFFPGHVVVYFDQSRLHPRNTKALVESVQEMLTDGEMAAERVMLVRQERGLFVQAPFGSSRSQLRTALDGLAKGTASGLDLEAETQQALQAIRSTWDQINDSIGSAQTGLAGVPSGGGTGLPGDSAGGSPRSVVGGFGSGAGPDACGPLFNQIGPVLDGFTRSQGSRIAATLTNLSDTASFLAGLPGIKVLLYLSDGLDTRPGAALASYAASLCPAQSADLLNSVSSLELSTPFMELTRHANANRVTIYAVQATGLRSPGAGSAKAQRNVRVGGAGSRGAFESTQRSGEREGLHLLADQTGGRAIFNRNSLGPELAAIGRDLGNYYSLAFEPAENGGRREHRLEVRLRDDSLSSRYRRGYLDKNADQWLAERIEGALNLGITSNPLEVRLGAGDIQSTGEGKFKLPLHVMVPVERLVFQTQDGAHVAEVAVRAMARSFTTSVLAIRDQTFRIKGAPGATGWANLTLEIELGEGAHATAVGIRDEASGEASYVATTLQTGL